MLLSIFLFMGTAFAADPPITFNNQIVRIFQQQCQTCHRPGNIAPFSLLSYSDAVDHAASIKHQVETRQMPPWKPVDAHGVFDNERTLTDSEIQTIVQWVNDGTAEGSPSDLPEPIAFPQQWTYSEPDRVVQPSNAYTLDPNGGEVYRCFSMPVNSQTDLNVRGYEVLPGNREIVHHVLLFIDRSGVSASLDAADPGPGYSCFGDPGFLPDGALGGWVPGMRPEMFPLGIGVKIPAGSRLVMQVHYSPLGHISHTHTDAGPPPPDLTRIGLFLSAMPLRQVTYVPVVNFLFAIPAGNSRYLVQASTTISSTVDLTAITPHMHLLGKEVQVEVRFPNGTTKELVHITDWDFQWQAEYTFKNPVTLPAGSVVTLKAWYDNSTNNPRNLNVPPITVRWGERTTDEMCLTFLAVTDPGARSMTQVPYTIGDRGGLAINSTGDAPSATRGYARLTPQTDNPTPEGIAIFGYRQNNILVSETAVAAAPLVTGGRLFAEIAGPLNTGIAMANPGSTPVSVNFYFTDSTGNSVRTGTTSIPANGKISKFLDEDPFLGPSNFTGTFTFSAAQPLSVVALRGSSNERDEYLLTTLPITDMSAAITKGPLLFPHFADGDGWATQILLVNPTDNTITGTLLFRGIDGTSQSSSSYTIAPRSSTRMKTSGTGSTLNSGSVLITPAGESATPAGAVIFSYVRGGVRVAEAGVPGIPTGTAFRVYVESSETGDIQSGVAIANSSNGSALVTLELTNLDGSSAARTTVSLPAYGHIGDLLSHIPGFEGLKLPFRGVLRITSATPLSVTGLRGRYNERGDFLITTTPPVQESAAQSTVEKYFAHFVNGGGYTTQFIVYSSTTRASGGLILFYSENGSPTGISVR